MSNTILYVAGSGILGLIVGYGVRYVQEKRAVRKSQVKEPDVKETDAPKVKAEEKKSSDEED